MENKMPENLVSLAIKYSNKNLSRNDVISELEKITPPVLITEKDESWYENNDGNTTVDVSSLVGDEITEEDETNFLAILEEIRWGQES